MCAAFIFQRIIILLLLTISVSSRLSKNDDGLVTDMTRDEHIIPIISNKSRSINTRQNKRVLKGNERRLVHGYKCLFCF